MTTTLVLSLTIVGVLIVLLGILRLRHLSLQSLVLGLIGSIIGLLLGALASVPLSKLPQPLGWILPLGVSVLITGIVIAVLQGHRRALLDLLPFFRLSDASAATAPAESSAQSGSTPASHSTLPPIIVDTSVIIDGRIADIATAGFVPGRLVVPRFVLAELQNIADSDDAMRRGRGRRGLDVLNRLGDMEGVGVEIIEDDVASIKEVDAKLVALAQKFSCNVLTTDYNLNRVAQIQGVRVLNVNELSNAIRPVVLPGEELIVRVVQPGKERNQGVGYLADGTMIVVENGDKLMGEEVSTEVTRVFQTVAGKMIFASPRKGVLPPHGHAQTVAPVAPPSEAIQPPAQPQTQPQPKQPNHNQPTPPAPERSDKDRKQQRYGRGRRRGPAASTDQPPVTQQPPVQKAAGSASHRFQSSGSIEDRIIAATSERPQPTDQSN